MPGIFYVYEFRETNFELIFWNKNHETITGYSPEELKNKNVFDFFYPEEYPLIEEGLGKILNSGLVKQVSANLKLKDGKVLPFLFEGYSFYSNDNLFFMGVGIDMTEFYRTKQKLTRAKAKMRTIKNELNKKERELLSFAMDKTKQYSFELTFKKQLKELLSKDLTEIKKALVQIENDFNAQPKENELWEVFKLRIIEVYPDFFKNLQEKHSNLTASELRICAYLKMKMSSENISSILNITKDGVKKSRYRLRKKLSLTRQESLDEYIDKF